MSADNHQQDLATQIREHHRSGELDKALEISERALESNPADLKAYGSRWELIAERFSKEDAEKTILPEIEAVLRTHCYETLGIYFPERILFEKMLQYPRTKIYQSALLGISCTEPRCTSKVALLPALIDECTASDVPGLSWYVGAHEECCG